MKSLSMLCFLIMAASTAIAQETEPSLNISLRDGFDVQLIRTAQEGEDSWISMTFDDQGRVLLGLDKAGVGRITYSSGDGTSTFERLNDSLKHCRGVLYAHDSLYVSATNSNGFYRLRDTNGDGQFDDQQLLFEMDYRSRYGHGSNQIVLGPDDMIYLVVGNDVSFPADWKKSSPYRGGMNDKLLTYEFNAGQDDRVGYILRLDPNGGTREIMAGGFRNQVDMAFNKLGEMFTYDADMEWDAGLPWYRPTRLNHVISGGEYGWRWGTMKWPVYYQDSLPSTLDTGYGSPTGIVFGYQSNFPERYKNAPYMADWQNGRIYLVDLIPEGSTYRAEYDTFLQGGPLNVCDMTFGPDGALYFITGGRGSKSGLYRVSWTGDVPAPPLPDAIQNFTDDHLQVTTLLRLIRRQLEAFHTKQSPVAVDAVWHHIASEDRWLRFSARVALENQDVATWRDRALNEATPLGSMTALMALSRVGNTHDQPEILNSLARQQLKELSAETLLGFLRVYALTFIRQGRPNPSVQQEVATRLGAIFPHEDPRVNAELAELLVFLDSPSSLEKTLHLLSSSPTQEEQIHYAMTLTHVSDGWSIEQRKQVLDWLQAARRFPGGKLVDQAVQNLILAYRAALSPHEQAELKTELAKLDQPLDEVTPSESLPIVRQWEMRDLRADVQKTGTRDLKRGLAALTKANCLKCHQMHNLGGRIGPDLSRVGSRFDSRALLESILEPSKVIDEKYRQTSYALKSGKVVTGRPVGVNAKQLVIEIDPVTGTTQTIDRAEIEDSVISTTSPMPRGLVNVLTRDEILDLIAYLRAAS